MVSFPGPIPEQIGKLVALEHLDMSFCTLIGTARESVLLDKVACLLSSPFALHVAAGHIPETMGNMVSLKVLILAANKLEGRIPESLGLLTNLEELDLCWNDLTGTD